MERIDFNSTVDTANLPTHSVSDGKVAARLQQKDAMQNGDANIKQMKERHPANVEDVKKAISEANDLLKQMSNNKLEFRVDRKTKETVVQIVDKTNGKVIKQIPPDDVLKFRERLNELVGILFDSEA